MKFVGLLDTLLLKKIKDQILCIKKQVFSSLTFVARQAHLIRVKDNHISYFGAKNESESIPVLFISVVITSTYHLQEHEGGDGCIMCYMSFSNFSLDTKVRNSIVQDH